jgi:hypothetical protein
MCGEREATQQVQDEMSVAVVTWTQILSKKYEELRWVRGLSDVPF